MSKVLVWDLPTRLIHWVLAAGFLICFGIAQLAGEHSDWFPVHMILGLILAFVVLLRIVWGFVGSRYARFGSLRHSPRELLVYMKGALGRNSRRYVGHNPGSAYATMLILGLILLVAGTGVMMSYDVEAAEEIHVPAAYALLAVVAVHILGVLWHSWRHRENLSSTMITGWKEAASSEGIRSSRPVAAGIVALLIGSISIGLFRNYDRQRDETRIPFVGTTIPLGESEHD